jgi:hypothetical protein
MEDTLDIKKRRLILNRETIMPLQHDQLDDVHGGRGEDADPNLVSAAANSASASGVVSGAAGGVASLAASESTSSCVGASAAVSAVASGVSSAVDHASNRLGVPCWMATSVGSAALHFTRKW